MSDTEKPSINNAVAVRFKFSRDLFAIHNDDGEVLGALSIGAVDAERFEQIFKEAGTYFQLIQSVAEHLAKQDQT